MTRRDLLSASAASLLGAALGRPLRAGAGEPTAPYVTAFYQFGKAALEALGPALPGGPGFVHIFSHSTPALRPAADLANMVHKLGLSFKFALAFDVHEYKGWLTASEEQLRAFAREYRACALYADGAADYFAFNEMPTKGAETPDMRAQVARIVRYLHDPGDGPKLRGVFYFTERNLNPDHWVGDADDFWAALDETCDLVVGEHYHSDGFVFSHAVEKYPDHLFRLPKWLRDSGKPAQVAIATRKYAVLHSSYYGPETTGWAGVRSDQKDEAHLEKYLEHCVAGTRQSDFGRRRIAFGPLATKKLDQRMLPALARVLGKEHL